MVLHAHVRPFLMNDVCEDGVLVALLDVVGGPVVGQLVARFLPRHALGNPLVAATMLLPQGSCAIDGASRV